MVLLLGRFVVGLVVGGIWVIIELFTVDKDAAGDRVV
jgi:predicted MFS family arabinose efflux permease